MHERRSPREGGPEMLAPLSCQQRLVEARSPWSQVPADPAAKRIVLLVLLEGRAVPDASITDRALKTRVAKSSVSRGELA